MTSIFGWIATVGTFLYKLPQIYKLYKTKSSNDVSSISLTMQTTGYVFYIVHGFIIDDYPTLVMGGISFLQGIILVILCCVYKKSKKNEEKEKYVKTREIELII